MVDLHALAERVFALSRAPVLVKFGGSVQDDPAQTASIIADICALARLGLRPIVVHGGGKAISAAMAGAGLQARFVLGQRYTDEATLRIAERVLCADINGAIVRALNAAGVPACGLTSLGACVLRASRAHATDKEGHPVDLGLVGRVEHVQAEVLMGLCARGMVPVLAPVALDADPASGAGRLNVNADLAAGEVARAIKPSAFILVSDTPGIRTVPSDPTTSARLLSGADVARLKQTGAIDGGMLPKVEACNMALDAGVERVAITDGRPALGLLRAALTDDFPGTKLVL